jgi:hypothetical protein
MAYFVANLVGIVTHGLVLNHGDQRRRRDQLPPINSEAVAFSGIDVQHSYFEIL